jgi:CheY-like chemotaxis protein
MNRHVMVVDDDQDIREGLTDALTFEGYEVYCASNGEEALDKLSHLDDEELPGCILLDLNMPRMDGKEFLAEVEHLSKLSEIPICIASASLHLDELKHLSAAVLRKPIDLDQLYGMVHKFCD